MMLANPGIVVEDFRLVGCYDDSFGVRSASRDKVLDVARERHDGAPPGRLAAAALPRLSCIQTLRLGIARRASCSRSRTPAATSPRATTITASTAATSGPPIAGSWFYDNEGFDIQMYPNCDGADAIGTGEKGERRRLQPVGRRPGPDQRVALPQRLLRLQPGERAPSGNGGEGNGFFRPIHCGPTNDNQAVDMILYDLSDSTAGRRTAGATTSRARARLAPTRCS